MNRMMKTMLMLPVVGMLCAPALFAQQRERPSDQMPGGPASRPGVQEPAAPRATIPETPPPPKASTFIGSSVVNAQGEDLGKIEDLMIDPATGRITYAALSYGSILGFGGKLFAVAWNALQLQPDGKTFILDKPKETLENAPGFDKSNWPQQPDPMLSASARRTGTEVKPSLETNASTGVSATVQAVNTQEENITLKTAQGEHMELQAPAAMLGSVQVGDVVEVKMTGTRATEIRKKE